MAALIFFLVENLECGDPAPIFPTATRRGRDKSKNHFLLSLSFSLRSNDWMGVRRVERRKAAPGRRTPRFAFGERRRQTNLGRFFASSVSFNLFPSTSFKRRSRL